MTSQGSAYARFRRALLTKNLTLVNAAARELPQISLEDALRIVVLLAEKRDPRYDRAAARWVSRAVAELRLGTADGRRLLALTEVLPDAPEIIAGRLRASVASRPGPA